MDNNEYKVLELDTRLGKIRLNRNLKFLSVGALSLVGAGTFITMSNTPIEEVLLESGTFFLGAFGFGISAIKKNKEVKILQKQINKLRNK